MIAAFHLEKDSYLSVSVLAKNRRVKVVVSSDASVNVALFSTSAFNDYTTKGEANAVWSRKNRHLIEDIVNLPAPGEYVFVIENCGSDALGGTWEIYE